MITVPSDYQVGDTKIPNAVSKNAGEPENLDLSYIISKHERELLLSLLGEAQYLVLDEELEKLPFTSGAVESAATEWVRMVNGYGDWIGLKSLCKNYVYCHYLRFMEVSVTTTGAGKSSVKNHSVTDYNQKYVERWNELTDWVNDDLPKFYEATDGLDEPDDYPVFEYENQFGL